MESSGQVLARTSASSYQRSLDLADNSYQLAAKDIRARLTELPLGINPQFEYAVVGYIQHFGWQRVYRWAQVASSKTHPERWLMTVMHRERYGH